MDEALAEPQRLVMFLRLCSNAPRNAANLLFRFPYAYPALRAAAAVKFFGQLLFAACAFSPADHCGRI
jgi:hypothetical protein